MTPVWAASYVIGLARSTGWPEQFILWELPLVRGLLYQHAALYAEGAKTIATEETLVDESTEIRRLIDGA